MIQKLRSILSADINPFAAAMSKAQKVVQGTKDRIADLGNKVVDFEKKANKSGFKKTFETLRGAGMAVMVSQIGQAFNTAVDLVSKGIEKVKSGQASVAEAVADTSLEIGKSMPLIGGFVSAGEKIGDMMSGLAVEKAKWAQTAQVTAANEKAFASFEKIGGTVEDRIRSLQRATAIANTSPLDAALLVNQHAMEDAQREIEGLQKQLNSVQTKNAGKERREQIQTEIEQWKRLVVEQRKAADATTKSNAATKAWEESRKAAAEAAKLAEKSQALTNSLREQIATWGMTADAIELYKLRSEGATSATINHARALQNQLAMLERSKTLTDLQTQAGQMGMTDRQKQLAGFAAQGATDEELGRMDRMLKQIDDFNAAKTKMDDLVSRGKSVFEATRTPIEKYETAIGELNELLRSGAINWQTYGRAVRAARGELESSRGGPTSGPDLVRTGSAEARRASFEGVTGLRKIKDDIPAKQLAAADEQTRVLKRIEGRLAAPIMEEEF